MSRFLHILSLSLTTALALSPSLLASEPTWLTTPGPQPPLLRKEFNLPAKPTKATVRIVGLGHFELRVNGRRAGDAVIRQPWSQYDKTIYFDEIDVTPLLQQGPNALGVMLGNSFWFNPPSPQERYHKGGAETNFGTQYLLWAQLDVEDANGQHTQIDTDTTWKITPGPVTFSHVYGGEDFDARRDPPGWDRPGFDDKQWKPASPASPPKAKLEKCFWPLLREKEVFPAKKIVAAGPGLFHVFFGQNASGIVRFTVQGKAGQTFTIQPSEYRTDDGQFMKPKWGAPVLFRYTLKGGGPETHQWLFHYNGFQAVEISGAVPAGHENQQNKDLPVIQKIELVHVRADLPEAGHFHTSSKLYNDTHQLIDWAIRSNATYVLSDCPHREKLGWLECAHLLVPSFAYRYDCRDWFAKLAHDIRDSQEPSGRINTVAPAYPHFGGGFQWTVEWGAAGVLLPWQHYVWYGDPTILRDNFDCMRRFVDDVAAESKNGIAPEGLGDWYDYGHGQPPGPSRFTPVTLTATAVQVMCIDAVIQAAEVLGRTDDAKRYRQLREITAAAYLKAFYNAKDRAFTNSGSCQCAHTISLAANLVPEADRKAVLDAVVADLSKRAWQQTPGDVGHVYFIRALAEAGRSDVLHRIYSRDGLGSYGGILKKGLTAMPETWDAMNDGCQSHNHCMLGHVIEWFYGYVAGIRQRPGSVGWRKILIAPEPGQLTECDAAFVAPTGRIVSRWTVNNGRFHLEAEIPDGTSAQLVAPDGTKRDVGPGRHTLEANLRQ